MDLTIDWLSLGPALTVLLILMGLDILMGLAVALRYSEVASITSYKGAFKKLGQYVGVGVGMCIDLLIINYQDSVGIATRPPITIGAATALAFCIHEAISVLEKLARLEVYMPGFLVTLLKRLKKTTDHAPGLTIKVESDIEPTADVKLAAKVAASRAKRTEKAADRIEQKVDTMVQQQVENSNVLKSIDETVKSAGDSSAIH